MSERPKILAVSGIAVGVLSYFCKDRVDALKRAKSSLANKLASYRNSLHYQSTQLNLLASRQQMEVLQRKNSPEGRKESQNINYSATILFDTVAVRQAQALVRESIDDVFRMIGKLAFRSADLRQKLEHLKAEIETNDRKTNEVLKPSSDHDWTRAAQVKLALLATTISGLPVTVFGDTVITRANSQVKALDFLVGFGRWAVRILFIVGVCLTLYGLIKGIKVEGVAE